MVHAWHHSMFLSCFATTFYLCCCWFETNVISIIKIINYYLSIFLAASLVFLLCGCCLPHCKCVLMVCEGETAAMTLPQMRHRQSMPNLSRSAKLSVATASRTSEQQRAMPGRRPSTQTTTVGSYRLQPQQKQPSYVASKVVPSRQQASPMRDFKSRAARELSPSSTKANGISQQPSRLTAASRCCTALLNQPRFCYCLCELVTWWCSW